MEKKFMDKARKKTVTLLRVPLLNTDKDLYDDRGDILLYFTITGDKFLDVMQGFERKMVEYKEKIDDIVVFNALPEDEQRMMKSQYYYVTNVIDDLTSCELDELSAKSELDSMHDVFLQIEESDIIKKELHVPGEFDRLYSDYVLTAPFISNQQSKKWKLVCEEKILSKEEFLWALYQGEYHLVL